MSLSKRLEERWYSGAPPLLLRPLAALYGGVTGLRRVLYHRGLLARPKLPVPVVVVGNVAIGGTGKSPLVAWLVRELQAAGYQPGIVSRGYGGKPQQQPLLVAATTDPAEAGDEPVMLAQQTGVPVIVCPDRVAAVEALLDHGVDVAVSDDGLQHYRLQRVAELVVVDGQRLFGNRALLPAGPLREPVARLADADLVLVNGGRLEGALSFTLEPGDCVSLTAGTHQPLATFAGRRVWAVAGIGNPQRFYDVLERAGVEAQPVPVADHAQLESLTALRRMAEQPILMTHKDAVKYAGTAPADCWYVPVELRFAPADAEAVMNKVTSLIKAIA